MSGEKFKVYHLLTLSLLRRVVMASTERVRVKPQEKEEKDSILDNLIDLLPFERHVPGYKFCGPGTKLAERIQRGDIGINSLDEACWQHDLAYNSPSSNRRQADRILAEYAFSRMLVGEIPPDERTVAMMTACCMVSKITFEKFFSRIKKVIQKRNKKNNKSKKDKIKEDKKSKEKKSKNKKNVE